MQRDVLRDLLAGEYPDPQSGEAVRVPTRAIVIRDTLEGNEDELVGGLGFEAPLAVVSDGNTEAVLGRRVKERLQRLGTLVPVVLPALPAPRADMETVEAIRRESSEAGAFVAVGSGTINDLCKYLSAATGRPYAVFPTAPSMNGYTSVNASITVEGHKSTLPAQAARGVFYDLQILSAAPSRLIRAGLGDSLSRPTAQADWLLSHLLLGTEYRELPFALLDAEEAALLESPSRLVSGDLRAMESLVRVLTLSGLGMTLCGGSQPASQGEHLISHYIDMFGRPEWPESHHGEQVAVTSLTMARLQAAVLEARHLRVAPCRLNERDFQRRYGPALGASFWGEFTRKRLDDRGAAELNARLEERWDSIRNRLREVVMDPERMDAILAAVGAPRRPIELGWPAAFYRRAIRQAREIRDRFTFLDLAADSGFLTAGALMDGLLN
ncbi:MAG: sn-glycerol-1-phosphate dehydrogenase [Spirochaetales bacterium]|nr:sn-glycerol-1-phosphate dehydrogenase [Spirochaetales bacterium]